MLFSSLIFLYLFLPVFLLLFYLINEKFQPVLLLIGSVVFYAWGGPSYVAILATSILINYLTGVGMGVATRQKMRKSILITGIVLNLAMLAVFKYTGFFAQNINLLTGHFGIPSITIRKIILPLGISFFTFKGISYLVTVYRREMPPQKNFIDLAIYISLFPQLIAGPISRYKDLGPRLQPKRFSPEKFVSGIKRFVLGLGKKVIIATPLAYVADQVFSVPADKLSTPLAWTGALFFGLQIYYDFSGYTDMAIGLGRMLGLEFAENFNFPYISRSFRDFWRRWHITLSTWFRDYLFLPVAYRTSAGLPSDKYCGLRTEKLIYMIATFLTFFLCGLWHGAAWTFLIWGTLHGTMLIIEHFGFGKLLNRLARPIQYCYMIFFLLISWVFFRSDTLGDSFSYLGIMFGVSQQSARWDKLPEFFNPGTLAILMSAILGSTRFFAILKERFMNRPASPAYLKWQISSHLVNLGTLVAVLFILALSTIYLAGETSNYFIYFKF